MSYFDRIRQSDIHVVLDHVTLSKGDFVNRTRILQRDGRPMWLTIPVKYGNPIKDTEVVGDTWRHKHRKAIQQNYGEEAAQRFHPLWKDGQRSLSWHCVASASWMRLGDDTECVYSSSLGGSSLGAKSELVLNLCKEVGATAYLSGPNGKDYLDLPAFERAGIEVRWHDYPIQQPVLSAVHDLYGKERVAV